MKYNIRIATSPYDVQRANNLVARVYYEKNYIAKEELPVFENSKTVMISHPHTDELIGCASMRMPDGIFESELLYGFMPDELLKAGIVKNKTVELGRFAIKPEIVGNGVNFIFFLLNWYMINYLKQNGFSGWMAILKPKLYNCLLNFGYTLKNVDVALGLFPGNIEIYKNYFTDNEKPVLVYSKLSNNEEVFKRYNALARRLYSA